MDPGSLELVRKGGEVTRTKQDTSTSPRADPPPTFMSQICAAPRSLQMPSGKTSVCDRCHQRCVVWQMGGICDSCRGQCTNCGNVVTGSQTMTASHDGRHERSFLRGLSHESTQAFQASTVNIVALPSAFSTSRIDHISQLQKFDTVLSTASMEDEIQYSAHRSTSSRQRLPPRQCIHSHCYPTLCQFK